jgi:hypothetical protein
LKAYVIIIDRLDGRLPLLHGIYKQYRHAVQEQQRLIRDSEDLFGSVVRINILGPEEITE